MAGFKSEENKQLFIKGLREANFTQEEIDREVKDIEGEAAKPAPAAASPSNSAAPPVADAKKDTSSANTNAVSSPWELNTSEPAQQLKRMAEARSQEGRTLIDNMTPSKDNLLPYGLIPAGAALAGYGLYKFGQELGTDLKSRFFGPKDQAAAKVEPTASDRLPASAQQPTSHEQWVANLSPEERTLYERSEEAKAARASTSQSMRNEPSLEPEKALISPETQTPEQIRQAKLAAASQMAQQSMVAAPPNVAAQPVVPTAAEEAMNRARTSQGFTGENTANRILMNAAKERLSVLPPEVAPVVAAPVVAPVVPPEAAPVAAAPVEPVAAAPVEAAPEAPKNTNEKILETINKVAPKAEAAPVEVVPEVAKTTKAPKPEYFEGFKKLPGTERQLLGTLGVANNTERAKALVNALKSTLPEGAALEFPKTEAGVSKGGMPNPQDVMEFTNKHLGTDMKLDEKGKFPADFKFTEENLTKMHQSILDEYANAKTPSAKAAAEKGFATLRSLVGLAGFGLLAYGSLEAYKHGKKTGDWTPAGELGLNKIAGAINPALLFATHMTGLNAGEEQELAKRRYNAMVGGGRGVAPSSTYQR